MFPNSGAEERTGTRKNRGNKMRKRFLNRATSTQYCTS